MMYLKQFSFRITYLLVLILFLLCSTTAEPPSIISIRSFQLFTTGKLSPVNTEFLAGSENRTVLSLDGYALRLECRANYPIVWITNGQAGKEFISVKVAYRQVKNVDDISTYNFTARLWFPLELKHTGYVKCAQIGNEEASTSLYIYARPRMPLNKNAGLPSPFLEEVQTPIPLGVVPCRLGDPNIQAQLWLHDADFKMQSVPDAVYDPKVGFILPNSTTGLFKCHVSKFVFPPIGHHITEDGLTISPLSQKLYAFEGDTIHLYCEAKKKIDFQKANFTGNVFTHAENEGRKLSIRIKGHYDMKSGTVSCTAGQDSITWTINFLEPPKVSVQLSLGDIRCERVDENTAFTAIKCDNALTCSLQRKCLDNGYCGENSIINSSSTSDGAFLVISPPPLAGFVQCSQGIARSLSAKRTYEYFTGLNRKIYFDWRNADVDNSLMEFNSLSLGSEMYTDTSSTFVCKVVNYLFQDSLRLVISRRNGTRKTLLEGKDYVLKDDEFYENVGMTGALVLAAAMNLTEDVVEIQCYAGWYNSTEWISSELKLSVFEPKSPEFLQVTKTKDEPQKENVITKVLTLGEPGSLECRTEGTPAPNISWIIGNISIENTTTDIKGHTSVSTITFDIVSRKQEGRYLCVAQNRIDSNTLEFVVMTQESNSISKAQLTNVIIGSVVGFIVLMGLLLLMWMKYKRTKAQLRDLSDDEINHFLKGNPTMIQQNAAAHENAYFMPYNSEFEIPITDLEFDVQNNLLGSGAYGIVVRGVYKHQPVAIKLTRPETDVTYFKALLSELKIIIYLGSHPNIVQFCGSFTQNIRQRMVYIIVELCDGGDLLSRLKEYQKALLGGKTVKETITKVEHTGNEYENQLGDAITEQNVMKKLIIWSHQIAEALQFMASKKVIHGDLAARNVLLTSAHVAKVTDFGLSRQLYDYSNYVKRNQAPLPWRWMAIESLNELRFSTQSDIWAYGVTLWEIFTLGDLPYPGMQWTTDFIDMLRNGFKLKQPKYATSEIYEIMGQCWNLDDEARPTFESMGNYFQLISEDLKQEYVNI